MDNGALSRNTVDDTELTVERGGASVRYGVEQITVGQRGQTPFLTLYAAALYACPSAKVKAHIKIPPNKMI